MSSEKTELTDFYSSNYDEIGRLTKDRAHTIEFLTTHHFLKKHLPLNCSVLDCCAGGGAYAFPLAKMGYKVTAGDLIKEHVEALRKADKESVLKAIYQGDVLDMSRFADNSFDAVLCLGALYHLQSQEDREKCIAECLRVLKTGGVFAFAYINRNAVFINHFKSYSDDAEKLKRFLKEGNKDVFYIMDFNEPEALIAKFPVEKTAHIGVDGLMYPLFDEINGCSDEKFNLYMEYHLATCEQPSIIGHSMHGVWIGQKK